MDRNHALKEYYEKGWELGLLKLCEDKNLERSMFKYRLLRVLDWIEESRDRSFTTLDVACGVGTTSVIIAKLYPKSKFTCVDISGIQIEAGQKLVNNQGMADRFEFLVGDVRAEYQTDKRNFNYIIACEIIEHLTDPEMLLENVAKYGDSSTRYIFSVPQGKSKNNNICYRLVDDDGKSQVVDSPLKIDPSRKCYEFYHHSYSLREAKALLERAGYRVVKVSAAHFLPHGTIGYYVRRLTGHSVMVDRVLNRITLDKCAGNLLFLCSR